MKKITLLIVIGVIFINFQAKAQVNCYENAGLTTCTGYDANKNRVETRTTKDMHGNTTTMGFIGNKRIETNTRKDLTGNKKTTGFIGNERIDVNYRKN